MREADVAIRLRRPTQPDLVQRKLFTVHNHAYASADYVHNHGLPQSADELDNHKILAFGPVPSFLDDLSWLERFGRAPGDPPRESAFRINSIYGLRRAVEAGLGIGVLPDYIVGDASMLMVMKGIRTASSIRVVGETGMAMLFGPTGADSVAADASVRLGSLKSMLMVLGPTAGRIEIVNTARRSYMMLLGDLRTGAQLAVLGPTGVFGNVLIVGRLDGDISAPEPGTANRLMVTGTGSTGTVTPIDAFEIYMGFTP